MFRILAFAVFLSASFLSYAQEGATHEPTSATDPEVKLHSTKKSKFVRRAKSRKTEREGTALKDSNYRAEARTPERHGKSVRKSRGSKRLNGEARVFRRHGVASSTESARKAKVKRSLGTNSQ